MRFVLLALLLGHTLPAFAEVRVEQKGDRLTVRADGATLRQVLDRLSQETGMKVLYEGAPLSQPISTVIADHTPAQAVLAVLEGQDLNFALAMDPAGTRVETLVFTETSTGTSRPRQRAPARRNRARPTPPPMVAPRPEAERPAPRALEPEAADPQPVPKYPRSPFTPGMDTLPQVPRAPARPTSTPQPNQGNRRNQD